VKESAGQRFTVKIVERANLRKRKVGVDSPDGAPDVFEEALGTGRAGRE
jgi:hypothetical protein